MWHIEQVDFVLRGECIFLYEKCCHRHKDVTHLTLADLTASRCCFFPVLFSTVLVCSTLYSKDNSSEANAAFQINLHADIGLFNIYQVSHWWSSGCHSSSLWSCGEPNGSCCFTLSQTTALDKEKQVFRRRRHQDVKLAPHLSHGAGAGASRSAVPGLSLAEFTSESDDYSPSSAGTVRSPTSPF